MRTDHLDTDLICVTSLKEIRSILELAVPVWHIDLTLKLFKESKRQPLALYLVKVTYITMLPVKPNAFCDDYLLHNINGKYFVPPLYVEELRRKNCETDYRGEGLLFLTSLIQVSYKSPTSLLQVYYKS